MTKDHGPKRKYTVSAKVLAANRRNLKKANSVAKAVRYRTTARRQKASRANLSKAQAKRRRALANRVARTSAVEVRGLSSNRTKGRGPQRPASALPPPRDRTQAPLLAPLRGASMLTRRLVARIKRIYGLDMPSPPSPQARAPVGPLFDTLATLRERFEKLLEALSEQDREVAGALAELAWRRLRAFLKRERREARSFYHLLADFSHRPRHARHPELFCQQVLISLGNVRHFLQRLTRLHQRLGDAAEVYLLGRCPKEYESPAGKRSWKRL